MGAGKRKRSNVIPLQERQWDAKVTQAALQAARDKLRLVDVSVSLWQSSPACSTPHATAQIKGQI